MRKVLCIFLSVLLCALSACETDEDTVQTGSSVPPVPSVWFHEPYPPFDFLVEIAKMNEGDEWWEKLREYETSNTISFSTHEMNLEDIRYFCQFLSQVGYVDVKSEEKDNVESFEFDYYEPTEDRAALIDMTYKIDNINYRFIVQGRSEKVNSSDKPFVMNAEIGNLTVPLYHYTNCSGMGCVDYLNGSIEIIEGVSFRVFIVINLEEVDNISFDYFDISYDLCGHYRTD